MLELPGCTPTAAWTPEEAAEEETLAPSGIGLNPSGGHAVAVNSANVEPAFQTTFTLLNNYDVSSDGTFFLDVFSIRA